MNLTYEEIIKLLEQAKSMGVARIKINGIYADFRTGAEKKLNPGEFVQDLEAKDLVKPMNVFDDLDEDEILYWATPHYEEIQDNKRKQLESVKEQKEVENG